jgi:hypothetical protein
MLGRGWSSGLGEEILLVKIFVKRSLSVVEEETILKIE